MMYFSVRKLQVQTPEGKMLLHSTELEIDRGKIIGIYGPNGAGKSSLLRTVAGVNPHFQLGEVWIDGLQITNALKPEIRIKNILYLGSEYSTPFEVRVKDLLDLGHEFSHQPQSIEEVIDVMGVRVLNSRLIHTLSDGERQWVMFARALIQNPKVLILDESFSKLDLDRLLQAASLLRREADKGMTILVAAHDLNFISEVSDHVALMQNGHVIKVGTVNEVFTSFNLEKLYPSLPLQVVKSPNSGKEKVIY